MSALGGYKIMFSSFLILKLILILISHVTKAIPYRLRQQFGRVDTYYKDVDIMTVQAPGTWK